MNSLDDDGIEARRPDAPAGLFLSRYGAWYHDGDRVRHAGLEGLLNRSVARSDSGGLIVTTGRDVLTFTAEDAPVFVRRFDGDTLVLSTERVEPLGRRAFLIDDEGHVRCATSAGAFWARLSRSATQTLLEHVDDQGRLQGPFAACGLTSAPAADWSKPPA